MRWHAHYASRPEAHINETFGMEIVQNIARAIVLDEKFAPNDDIRRYFKTSFSGFLRNVISPRSHLT